MGNKTVFLPKSLFKSIKSLKAYFALAVSVPQVPALSEMKKRSLRSQTVA